MRTIDPGTKRTRIKKEHALRIVMTEYAGCDRTVTINHAMLKSPASLGQASLHLTALGPQWARC